MDDMEAKREYQKARKAEANRQAEIDQTYRDLLSVPRGREFLWHLLEIGKVGLQPHTNNALSTAFNCGELNVGQQILSRILTVDASGYVRMLQEKADGERARNAGNADDAGDGDD